MHVKKLVVVTGGLNSIMTPLSKRADQLTRHSEKSQLGRRKIAYQPSADLAQEKLIDLTTSDSVYAPDESILQSGADDRWGLRSAHVLGCTMSRPSASTLPLKRLLSGMPHGNQATLNL